MKVLLKTVAALLLLISVISMSCTKETALEQPSMIEFKAAPANTAIVQAALPASIKKDK